MRIEPDFAADDHRHLGVGLPFDEAVDDLDSGSFQPVGPQQILFFVEPRLEFDHGGDRLARLGSRDQRVDDRRLLAGAIQRLLDRDDVGILGRLPQEGHHRLEAFIGMVDDEILGADRRKNVAVMLGNPLGKARRVGREFQHRQVGFDQLRKIGDPDDPGAFGNQRAVRRERIAHALFQVGRGSGVEFESDHPPAPPPLDCRTEVANQILGLLVHFQIAVAKHAECALMHAFQTRGKPGRDGLR